MAQNFLIIDGNSIGNAANNTRVLQLGNMQVQAVFVFLKMLRSYVSTYQHYTPVVLWDGASWRNMMFSDYKSDRDLIQTPSQIKAAEAKIHYKKQVPMIKKALRMLGIPQVLSLNMEADDMAAIMTDRYVSTGGRVILMTGDQDWIQLVGPNVVWKDPIGDRIVTHKNFEEFTGVKTIEQFIEVKALSGDKGDSIPGVGGVGKDGAIAFLNKYGSFANFVNAVSIEKSVDFNSLPKKFKALIEDEAKAITFDRNITLMNLRTTERPTPSAVQIDKGTPNKEEFQRFCELLLFNSITSDLDSWLAVFPNFRNALAA